MSDSVERRLTSTFVDAADPGVHDGFYAVLVRYPEAQTTESQGSVCRCFVENGKPTFQVVLETNDTLSHIWASPEHNMWVGSASGRVWTTANVERDSTESLYWTDRDPTFKWRPLDIRTKDDAGRNVSALWGSSDTDVYLATFDGRIVHWNGVTFTLSHSGDGRPVSRMGGTSSNDIWAVGRDGLVLHFDGTKWLNVSIPDNSELGETLTDVCVPSAGDIHVCSTSGAIFRGSVGRLERVGLFAPCFYGMVEYNGRLLLAGGNHGPCELKGASVEALRTSIATTGVHALGKRVGFIEPAQETPSIVVYDSNDHSRPWRHWNQ
jgi:hypothetical protein